jgi:hypothetical protein
MKLIWIAFALALAACGKSSDRSAGSNAASAAAPPENAAAGAVATEAQDRCEVHITGSQTLDVIGTKPRSSPSPKMSAGSEYWMTEDELRNALAMMVRIGGDKPSKEALDRKVDEKMKKDPRLWLLVMNCSTDDGFLSLSASNSSKSADIPFGPHTYVIASDPKAGEFDATFSIKRGKHTSFHLTARGKLEIAKFDATGIAATFGFEAESRDGSQHVSVKGSFDFGCAGQKCK